MSSDNYFDDDFDDVALAQLDAIEAAALAPTRPRALRADSSIDIAFDIDESDLQKLDQHVAQQYNEKVLQVPGPSRSCTMNRTNSGSMLQTTLFGDVLLSQPSTSKPKSASRSMFGQQAAKTKTWDHTAFAQSGMKRTKKAKGKGKATEGVEDEDGFELPPPFVPIGPPPPMKLKPDLLEAKHWIFPTNRAKRDYQFNIVKNCFFDNTLVALPTGLGKTFVAGVVMLNYYRWYPEGKIVFVAPTKPLVAQQITASHETCGIPGSDGVELTGQVQSTTRSRFWQQKRVFYMTPQTLEQDLLSGICDPMDIILLVIDEAHHATGEYAYNKVVRFMMAKNPHFRLLALTATPGNNTESVQNLIDGLHISKIEIRNENSLDLKPYIFEKVVKSHIIKPCGDVLVLRDLLLKAMDPIFKPLKNAGLFYPAEQPLTMHPFRPMRIGTDGKHPLASKYFAQLSNLSLLARGVLYLLTGSISSCRDYLEDKAKEGEVPAGSKQRKNPLFKDPNFQTLMKKLGDLKTNGSTAHPKMEKLKDILIAYFGGRMQEYGNDEADKPDDTRVMVFSSYRAVVDEIIGELDQHRPLIRAAAFIGQGSDKRGRKGLTQKEQIQLIERFQAGEFNVLVATSIGEEGLDIGEIDLTICYDTDKAPTRMIQRFGRTGRKRAGEVHVLLAEAREEFNLDKAKGTYKEVQKVIDRGEVYELYGDVPRLLPENIKPECIEKVMEIQPYVREDLRKSRAKAGGAKRKRNTDINRNIPPDMPTTFTSANSIWNQFKKRKVDIPEDTRDIEELGEDDDLDKEIESGSILDPVRRTQSDKPQAKKKAPSAKLRRAATSAGSKRPATEEKKKAKKAKEVSLSDLAKQGEDDEVDLEIENGLWDSFKPSSKSSAPSRSRKFSPVQGFAETWDLPDTDEDEAVSDGENEDVIYSPQDWEKNVGGEDMGWLVDDDEDMFDGFQIGEGSPSRPSALSPQFDRFDIEDESIEISQAVPSRNKGKQKASQNPRSSSPDIEVIDDIPSFPRGASFRPASEVSFGPETTISKRVPHKRKTDMPPPPLPSCKSAVQEELESTFPVKQPKRRRVVTITSSDDDEQAPPPSQSRLHRQVESAPVRPKKSRKPRREKISLLDKVHNPLFDAEAIHSGSEVSEGYSEEEEERSSDREFLKDSPSITQVSPSYEQTQVYRQSLFTQAPVGSKAPSFGKGPVRARPFGRIDSNPPRTWLPSSSPPTPDEELDEYQFGSFIVPDENDISLELNSEDVLLDDL